MAGTELRKVIEVSGVAIHGDAGKLVSLTDLWKAAGSEHNKQPIQWLRWGPTKEFVASLAENLKLCETTLTKSRRGGRNAGTWAHWQIAIAYAKWLSPEFHQLVNAAFVEWAEEKRDPGLKIERGVEAYIKAGKSAKWVAARVEGIANHKHLKSVMTAHGCGVTDSCNPFMKSNQLVAIAATGERPSQRRASLALKKSASTRDTYTTTELAATLWAESASADLIEKRSALGNEECLDGVKDACKIVRDAREALAALV